MRAQSQKQWKQQHRQSNAAGQKKWRAQHTEQYRAYMREYMRARRRNQTVAEKRKCTPTAVSQHEQVSAPPEDAASQ